MRSGAHGAVRPVAQQFGNSIDQSHVNERLVTLHIHDHGIVGQAQQCAGLSKAITATGVCGGGHHGLYAKALAFSDHLLTVSSNDNVFSFAELRALGDAHNHRRAADVGQRFVRKPCGGQSGRYEDGKAHRAGCCSEC